MKDNVPLNDLARVLLWVFEFSRHHLKLCINHTNKYIRRISTGICRGPKFVLSSVQGELQDSREMEMERRALGFIKKSAEVYPRLDILENQSGIYEKSTR